MSNNKTVAEGKSENHIENDFNQLLQNWYSIEKADNSDAPTLVCEDLATASSVVRDLLTP